jgi:protein-S-isoprenylcysteine O-methyltransferase Ste14
MFVLYLIFAGILIFVVGVGILGLMIRQNPTKTNAVSYSRVAHFLYFAGLGFPVLISFFYPGVTKLDGLTGLTPLPAKPYFLAAGFILLIPGLYLFVVSNGLLRKLGLGANAFRLTNNIVEADIYQRTRNPMSLGYYMGALSLGFISGSTALTLIVVLGFIPAHLFFLKFFEEKELELRFGESYMDYKQSVPFLFPKISID